MTPKEIESMKRVNEVLRQIYVNRGRTITELQRQLKWCHWVIGFFQICIGLLASGAMIWVAIQQYPY